MLFPMSRQIGLNVFLLNVVVECCMTDCAVRSVSCPASLHPSMVNVHIQHPHEAEVQIHQVARVKPGQRPPAAEGAHSVQQRSQPGNSIGNGHGHTRPHNRQNGYVGRCFQETVDGQV